MALGLCWSTGRPFKYSRTDGFVDVLVSRMEGNKRKSEILKTVTSLFGKAVELDSLRVLVDL
jgi:hypothetical protein